MRMPVESPSVGMNGAENADIQHPSFAGGVQQVIDGQAAEVVEQPAVDLKQRPQRIRKGEDEVYPVAVRQAVKLGGNPEVGGLFPAGRAGPAVAGVGDVFYVVAAGVIAAVFLHTADAGATGEHFCDSFNFDITEAASVKEGGPALVGSEQFFEWRGLKSESTVQINSRLPAVGRVPPHRGGAPVWRWRRLTEVGRWASSA